MLFASTLLAALVTLAPSGPTAASNPNPPPTQPEVLQRAWVNADADWVVHFDVAAALGSELASILDEAWNSEDFAEVQQKLGLDPRHDITSVTAYGSADDPERPVILILGDLQMEQALDRLAGEATRSVVSVGEYSLDKWSEHEGDDDAMYTYMARREGSEKRVLVASPDAMTAATGVAVMRGDITSLADDPGDFAAGGGPSAGAFLFVAVREGFARLKDIDPSSRVAQLVESAVIEGGEFQGEAFLRITVGATNAADAAQISSVFQGASALLTLAAQAEEEARPLLPLVQGLTVSAEDSLVTVRFRYPSSKLIKMAQEASEHRPWPHRDPAPGADDEPYRKAQPAKPAKKKDGWY